MRVGNRVTEKDLRAWLDQNSWDGKATKIDHLELHAIRRPGWEQVFRFAIKTRKSSLTELPESFEATEGTFDHDVTDQWHELWGAIHDDERHKANHPSVWIFDSELALDEKLNDLSADLIVLRQGQTASGLLPLLAIVAATLTIAALFKYFLR